MEMSETSFVGELTINGREYIDVEVDVFINKGEPWSYDYPGCEATFDIETVRYDVDEPISLSEEEAIREIEDHLYDNHDIVWEGIVEVTREDLLGV